MDGRPGMETRLPRSIWTGISRGGNRDHGKFVRSRRDNAATNYRPVAGNLPSIMKSGKYGRRGSGRKKSSSCGIPCMK